MSLWVRMENVLSNKIVATRFISCTVGGVVHCQWLVYCALNTKGPGSSLVQDSPVVSVIQLIESM